MLVIAAMIKWGNQDCQKSWQIEHLELSSSLLEWTLTNEGVALPLINLRNKICRTISRIWAKYKHIFALTSPPLIFISLSP